MAHCLSTKIALTPNSKSKMRNCCHWTPNTKQSNVSQYQLQVSALQFHSKCRRLIYHYAHRHRQAHTCTHTYTCMHTCTQLPVLLIVWYMENTRILSTKSGSASINYQGISIPFQVLCILRSSVQFAWSIVTKYFSIQATTSIVFILGPPCTSILLFVYPDWLIYHIKHTK